MLRLLLCHPPAASEAARQLACELELRAEVTVSLASTEPGESTLLDIWDAEDASAVLLLLAPDCVPAQSSRAAWQPLLDHLERRASPPVAIVVWRDCAYPLLLKRAPLFLNALVLQDRRALAAWLISLHLESLGDPQPSFHPAPLPATPHDPSALDALWLALADGGGVARAAGPHPSLLAQSFAFQAGRQFRDTLWLDCHHRPPACLAGECASLLGARPTGHLDDAWNELAAVLAPHRLLLILDGLDALPPALASLSGRASFLITPPPAPLPPAPPVASPLWPAILASRPSCFPLSLAARIAGLSFPDAHREAQSLAALHLLAPLDLRSQLYRRLAAAPVPPDLRASHAHSLSAIFLDRDAGSILAARCAAELDPALDYAFQHEWPLATTLANRAVLFFELHHRRFELVHYLQRIIRAAAGRGDQAVEARFRRELAWLVDNAHAVHAHWQPGQQGLLFA